MNEGAGGADVPQALFYEKGHFGFENKTLIWYNKFVNGITKERAVNGVGKV